MRYVDNSGETAPLTPTFISWCENYLRSTGVKTVNSMTDFGLQIDAAQRILQSVHIALVTPELDHEPSISDDVRAQRIVSVIDRSVAKAMNQLGLTFQNRTFEENFLYFARFEGINEWARTHIQGSLPEFNGRKPIETDIAKILGRREPATVCGPFSWIIVRLCTLAGLKDVFKIEGAERGVDSQYFAHAWVMARLPSGAITFCDPSNARLRLDLARKRRGETLNPYAPSLEPWAQGYFLYNYHSSTVIRPQLIGTEIRARVSKQAGPKQDQTDVNSGASWREWINVPITREMVTAKRFFGRDMLTAAVDR